MRALVVMAIMLVGAALPADAQQAAPPADGFILGGRPAPVTQERCVEVEIGGSSSFGCLNQKLKREVDRVNPTPNLPPVDAHSPDTHIGVVNVPAVQQQYGSNFGKSVIPFRPPPSTYGTPSLSHR